MSAMTRAVIDILAERTRQIFVEGWTENHDDAYMTGDLALAAASYAYAATLSDDRRKIISGIYSFRNDFFIRDLWPWAAAQWKPKTPRADLVRAGALILAEIERLDRSAAQDSTLKSV